MVSIPSICFPDDDADKPVVYESHAHTIFCGHATGATHDYCERAIKLGLTGIIFTEHNPMPPTYEHQGRLQAALIPSYVNVIERTRQYYRGALDVRLGIECDYLPEYESFVREQLSQYPFAYILGSVHCQFPNFQAYAKPSDGDHFEVTYFDLMARAAESGLFTALAHPHLCNVLLKRRTTRLPHIVNLFLDRLAATGVALEINTGGLFYWDQVLYGGAIKRNIPIVVAGDAHEPAHVGEHFVQALQFLKRMEGKTISIFLDGERIDTPIREALAHLAGADEPTALVAGR